MKKLIAMIMVVVTLTAMSLPMAYGETIWYGYKDSLIKEGDTFAVDLETGKTVLHRRMTVHRDDGSSELIEVIVNENGGIRIAREDEQIWKKQKTWYQNVGAFLTFWNPDD